MDYERCAQATVGFSLICLAVVEGMRFASYLTVLQPLFIDPSTELIVMFIVNLVLSIVLKVWNHAGYKQKVMRVIKPLVWKRPTERFLFRERLYNGASTLVEFSLPLCYLALALSWRLFLRPELKALVDLEENEEYRERYDASEQAYARPFAIVSIYLACEIVAEYLCVKVAQKRHYTRLSAIREMPGTWFMCLIVALFQAFTLE